MALFGFHRSAQTLIIELHFLIFLFELLLETFDIGLESLLALFVLTLESQDLVVELGCLSGVVGALLVVTARQIFKLVDGCLHAIDALLSKDDLVSHACNANAQVLVVSLDIVQSHLLVL